MANNVTINGKTYDLSSQSDRATARTENPGYVVDATSVYNRDTGQQTNATSSGGGVPNPGTVQAPGVVQPSAQQYAQAIQQAVAALNSSDLKAFNEQVRQWNATFGFNQQQFQENVRQYNQNFGVTEAGLTGTYQGAPTQQALNQQANFLGSYQGQQTLQAQNQYFNQALAAAGLTGQYNGQQTLQAQEQAYRQQLDAINAAAAMQANPFRQAQVIGQLGGVLGNNPTPGFGALGQAQGQTDFSGMGNMQRMIDDIRGGPGAINSQSTQGILQAIPTPNKVNSVDFMRSSPNTQNIVLQGMQEKYGLSPEDSLAQIKNTLPQFTSPTTFGGVRR